jgi:hypothetical protein
MTQKTVGIRFKAQAYRMLKAMPGKLWFVFSEFIDNSISSYLQNKEELHKIYGPKYKLIIEINFDNDDTITISDNAAGIDERNWERALNPGDVPDDISGLNEFGMGMKYSAVWLSNKWTLKSRSIFEKYGREVTFDYKKVITQNLEELEYKDIEMSTGTVLILKELEQDKLRPFQWVKTRNHIASIYRNFLRKNDSFFNDFIVDNNIEIRAFGERLNYEEKGFLFDQWYVDRQNKNLSESESPKIEWKFKFSEKITLPGSNSEYIFSGFVGILPEIKQGNNGFSFFRRGRVIEGSGDEKIFPPSISSNPSSFTYKRLYGEFHFNDTETGHVESTFNKSAFQNRDFIDYCISQVPRYLKNIEFAEYPGKKFNLRTQALEYRSNFNKAKAEASIKEFNKVEQKKIENIDFQIEVEKQINNTSIEQILQPEPEKFDFLIIPEDLTYSMSSVKTGVKYNFILSHFESGNDHSPLYDIQRGKVENIKSIETREVRIMINLKHEIFIKNESLRNDHSKFSLLINMIRCLAYSECISLDSGGKNVHILRNSMNQFINIFINE